MGMPRFVVGDSKSIKIKSIDTYIYLVMCGMVWFTSLCYVKKKSFPYALTFYIKIVAQFNVKQGKI